MRGCPAKTMGPYGHSGYLPGTRVVMRVVLALLFVIKGPMVFPGFSGITLINAPDMAKINRPWLYPLNINTYGEIKMSSMGGMIERAAWIISMI